MSVNDFSVQAPSTVKFRVTLGENVTGCAGKLFFFEDVNDESDLGTVKAEWESPELTQGVTFEFDATGDQGYQISLAVTANAATTLTADTTFPSGSPAAGHDVVPIDPDTDNEPAWNFEESE